MRITDFIKKYGWTAMVQLQNAGSTALWNGNVYFVDNESSNALDNAGKETGNSWTNPFSTLNFAISQCTDGQGDIILVAPNHAETIDDAGTASGTTTDELVIDKTDITIIGLGEGIQRPTFTMGSADTTAACVVTAATTNVTVKGLRFVSGIADCGAAITLTATSDGFTLENCEFRDGGASKEFINIITIAAACNDVRISGCTFLTTNAGSSTLANIQCAGAADRLIVEDCVFFGDSNTKGQINLETAKSVGVIIRNNVFHNHDAVAGLCVVFKADSTGLVYGNYAHGGLNGTSPYTVAAATCFENYATNAEGASGFLSPGVDT